MDTMRFPSTRRSRSWLRSWALVPAIVLVVTGVACGGDDDASDVSASETASSLEAEATTGPPTAPAPTAKVAKAVSGDIVVLAAASLTEAFNEVKAAFEQQYPGTSVKFSFDSSSSLATQANQGAPADVFASADDANMNKVTDAGTAAGGPQTFVRNRLAILVAKGNPKAIAGLKDFEKVIYVLCAPGVPCGTYGEQALGQAGVDIAASPPRSREANVKAVVTRITTGEADAGIVYVTDARASVKDADRVDIPDEHNVTASYPMVALEQAPNPAGAAAFMTFLLSPAGQDILSGYGFVRAT